METNDESKNSLEDFLKNIQKKILDYCKEKKVAMDNRDMRNMAAIEWIEKFYTHEYRKFLEYKNI